MEEISTDSTPQRPEGSRILNAQLVEMNLHEFIDQIKQETAWTDSDRNSITIFKSETLRIVLIGLQKNAVIKPHQANGVINIRVLKGKIDFITAQQNALIKAGQMIALPANVTHHVIARWESFFLLTLAMNCK